MATSERKKGFKMKMHEVVKGITIPSMNVYMCHCQQQNLETKMKLSEPPSLTPLQVFGLHIMNHIFIFEVLKTGLLQSIYYNRRGENSAPKIIPIS
jgi:hypothetical protein